MPRKRSRPEAAPARDALLTFADSVAQQESPAIVPAPEAELHLVTFRLDRELFAVPIERVREVVRVTDITRVPHAPPHIRGVTNLRGRILPVVELRTRLGLPPAELTPQTRLVVVEAQGRTLGLLVDSVARVTRVPASSVMPPPPEVLTARTDFIPGVIPADAGVLILLDLDQALLLSQDA